MGEACSTYGVEAEYIQNFGNAISVKDITWKSEA